MKGDKTTLAALTGTAEAHFFFLLSDKTVIVQTIHKPPAQTGRELLLQEPINASGFGTVVFKKLLKEAFLISFLFLLFQLFVLGVRHVQDCSFLLQLQTKG